MILPFLLVICNRSFRNLWFAQITSQIAINMLYFVLALRIYQTTASNTAVSFLILTVGIPAVLFGVLAGTLVDRWDKRKVMIATNLVRMILLFGFFASLETLPLVYLLVFAISITTQFFVPAEAPTIPRLVPADLLLTANSLFTFTFYTSMIVGFAFSGPTLRFFGPHNIFLFLAALLALAAFLVSQIPPEERDVRVDKADFGKVWREFLSGIAFIKGQGEIFGAIFLLTASQALITSLASLAPGFAQTILKIQIEDASYVILGPAAIGMIAGALIIGQYGQRFARWSLINLGIISAGILLFFLSAVIRLGGLPTAVLLLLFLGVAHALVDVPANTILQENALPQFRGRVYGVLTSAIGGAAILPVILTGMAADIFGIERVILAIAGLIIFYGIYRLVKGRYNRKVLSIKLLCIRF